MAALGDHDLVKLGDCIEAIGGPDFTDEVHRYFDHTFGIAYSAVSVFPIDMAMPLALHAGATRPCDRDLAASLAAEYVKGDHLRDVPLMRHAHTRFNVVYTQSTNDVEDQRLKEHYYQPMGIACEMSGFINVRGLLYYIGMFRGEGEAAFDAADQTLFSAIIPLISRAFQRHHALTGAHLGVAGDAGPALPPSVQRAAALADLAAVIGASSRSLTARESQVCAAMVLGYTTPAIATLFDISMNTVATHRKRAYAKLRISSQSELFMSYSHIARRAPC